MHEGRDEHAIGAGDQGIMFGYATDETEECMPLTLTLAHNLNKKIADLRKSGEMAWARPDSKTQVTCEYQMVKGACIPLRVHTVVISVQHCHKISLKEIKRELMEYVSFLNGVSIFFDFNSYFYFKNVKATEVNF